MDNTEPMMTGAIAVLFALPFLIGGHFYLLRMVFRDDRNIFSFGSGVAVAYVFVRVMPELGRARLDYVESTTLPIYYEGRAIYLLALVGFLVFYGLDHLRRHIEKSDESSAEQRAFNLRIGGLAAYVCLVAYLLADSEGRPQSIGLYAMAMIFHFLSMDHGLRKEHGDMYARTGRFVLAAMCLVGWLMGQLIKLPDSLVPLLLSFISGGIVVNSTIMELPKEKDGRFWPFLAGGILYALILLPLS